MRKKYFKLCFFVVALMSSIAFTGCSNSTQKVLVLDKNEPIEALRATLATSKQSDLLTPLSNAVSLTTLNATLNVMGANILQAIRMELPTGHDYTPTDDSPQTSWQIPFVDLNNRSWTLTVPANGVVYQSSNNAQIRAYIYFGATSSGGGLDITFYMLKEGSGSQQEWVIDDIEATEILSVTTGITGRVTSSVGNQGIENAIVTAYNAPYQLGDSAVSSTTTNAEGYYELFLPLGEYHVLIAGDGYTYFEQIVTVD